VGGGALALELAVAKTNPKKLAARERERLATDAKKKPTAPDPLSSENIRKMALRIGIPVLIGWVLAIWAGGWIIPSIMGVITIALAGVAWWAIRYAQRSKAVVEILQNADTPEARKEALAKLESGFKKDDTAAIFAKAQLEMQEDPRKALATLEQINLAKVMATVADEARAQRAMIHLILGETDEARALVDKIDLSRQSEVKSRATLSAIVAEAFARSGDAKRAVELLDKFDLADAAFTDLKPQLLRAKAFAYAWANNTKQMRRVLQELKGLNVQYLMGFVTKKKHPGGVSPRGVHPMLEKEAFDLVMKSGMVQRRTEMRRG
jgi:tetratricopeptide (TPR) repeat protein